MGTSHLRETPQRRQQRGLGIIELMIGVALGLLVIVGVSMIFVSTRQASRSSDSLGHMQETLRTSYDLMTRDLRDAGNNPCDAWLDVANVLNNAQGGTPAWWVDWEDRVHGYDGSAAFAGAPIGSATGERVAGTEAVMVKSIAGLADLTVVSHATATSVMTVNANPHGVAAGDLLMVCDYRQAAVLQASAVTATTIAHTQSAATSGNCSGGLGLPVLCTATGNTFEFSAGAKIGRLAAVGWYIGNNGRPATGGRSLYRVTAAGFEEVAEGVQDMQLEYLQPPNTSYANASAVTDWNLVVGMRVTLTLQSAETGVSTVAGGRLQRPLAFNVSFRNRMP